MAPDFDPQQYWSARLEQAFSLDGVGWHGLGEGFNRWSYRVRRRAFARAARGAIDGLEGARVIDVGSGTGFYVGLWHDLGAQRVTGSDLTEVAVRRLQARNPADRFLQLDITAGPEDADLGAFDAVSAMDMLYHIVDDEAYARAIGNLAALLRPGGVLIFSENLVHDEWLRVEHQVSRGLDWISARLREADLEIVSRRPLFALMNTPVDSRQRALHLWWRWLTSGLHRWPRLGWAVGAALYPLELIATSLLSEGPSTELVVCRKRGSFAEAASSPANGHEQMRAQERQPLQSSS